MSEIDRQRRAAVGVLEAAGYMWRDGAWQAPGAAADATPKLIAAADAMHGEIVGRCEDLAWCTEDSPDAEELARLVDLAQAYEAARPRD